MYRINKTLTLDKNFCAGTVVFIHRFFFNLEVLSFNFEGSVKGMDKIVSGMGGGGIGKPWREWKVEDSLTKNLQPQC